MTNREMDRKVAVDVMGLALLTNEEMETEARKVWESQPDCRVFHLGFTAEKSDRGEPVECKQTLRPYSGNLDAAWLVVEKMRARTDGHFTLMAFTTNWRCIWTTPTSREDINEGPPANSAASAICLAALEAVRVE